MTHFLEDQMKSKKDPSLYELLIEKVKFGVKNEEKLFYQMKDHYFLFLNGEIFYQTLSSSNYESASMPQC